MSKSVRHADESTKSPPGLLGVGEVARRLSVSHSSVWRLLTSRALPKVRIGRTVRIPASALERFIAGGGVARG